MNDLPMSSAAYPSRRAAAYVRMSTDRQIYSTANQMQRIQEYATEYNITIVAVYEDAGKSGLTMRGRPGLQQLIADVQTKNDFTSVLVHDVSRWGRFQDVDESAYYEYICRLNGVHVTYCTEAFQNDGSPYTTIIKALKRIAAAEYSRELSSKVFAAQCRISSLGYKMGGQPGYGLRRALLASSGEFIRLLLPGEWKAVQTHRVVLVPGPKNEIVIVNQVFKWYVEDGMGDRCIAALLNRRDVESASGRPWTGELIRGMLRNEKYIGNLVFNKGSYKLRKAAVRNPPAEWVRCDGAFSPIVPVWLFQAAVKERRDRNHRYTTDDLLDLLRRIYSANGRISTSIIDDYPDAPTAQLFSRRFGTLYAAYALAGIPGSYDGGSLVRRTGTLSLRSSVVAEVKELIIKAGGNWHTGIPSHTLRINNDVTLSIRIVRCTLDNVEGNHRWRINKRLGLGHDFLLLAVLDQHNEKIEEYMLISSQDIASHDISFTEVTRWKMKHLMSPILSSFF